MKPFKLNPFYLLITLGSLAAFGANTAFAGAFQLPREYNAVEIGNSGSGGAAIANDASTAWANPAGMMRLKNKQLVISGDALFTHAKFSGTNTNINSAVPFPFTQSGTATTTDRALIPALYFVSPVNFAGLQPNKWSAGFSVTSPFGLSTNYGNNSVLRYSGTIAKIQVIDISPDVAFNVNDNFSFGAGADIERVGLDLRAVAGLPFITTTLDTLSKNVGDGWGYGFHTGVLYQLTQQTRVGFTYHSSVNVNVTGSSRFNGALAGFPFATPAVTSTGTFRTKLILPPYSVLSAHHDFNSQWAIDGTLGYTQWDVINGELTAYNLSGNQFTVPFTVSIPQHYSNSWLIALGGSYQINQAWLLRAGASFDQSPVKSSERIIFIPDANRLGFSVGAHFQANKAVSFDAGYMYMMFNNAKVSAPLVLSTQTSTANGTYNDTHLNIVGLQMNWSFV